MKNAKLWVLSPMKKMEEEKNGGIKWR